MPGSYKSTGRVNVLPLYNYVIDINIATPHAHSVSKSNTIGSLLVSYLHERKYLWPALTDLMGIQTKNTTIKYQGDIYILR